MIVGFIGLPRTGKTLLMIYFAFLDFINGSEIMANLLLKSPFKYTRMNPYDMLKIPFDVMDREKKTLLIQEADKWFNARRSMRNENVLLGGLTGQSGKRNLNIYWDTQFPHLVDNQLREVTDVVFHASVLRVNGEPVSFQYTKEDRFDTRDIIIPAELLKPYYDMYDSYDTTPPLTETKSMKEIHNIVNPEETEYKNTRKGKKKVVYY